MVNLVRTIESTVKHDEQQMKYLKKLLRKHISDINKLRQSTQGLSEMIAPIHAAINTENTEILHQLLATKEVNVDATTAIFQVKKEHHSYPVSIGVIFAATNIQSLDILKLLLEHVQEPRICLLDHHDGLGIPQPLCLANAVGHESLDIIDVLLRKADLLGKGLRVTNCFGEDVEPFSPFYCLIMAVDLNKPVVFKHLLMSDFQGQLNVLQHQLFAFRGRRVTLLEFILFHKRAELQELLTEKFAEDVNSGEYDKNENYKKEKNESEPGFGVEEIAGQDKLVDIVPFDTKKGNLRTKNCEAENKKVGQKTENSSSDYTSYNLGENSRDEGVNDKLDDEKKPCDNHVRRVKYCWNCENVGKYMCSGCRKARYCTETCQWEDWHSHKEYCLVKMNKIAFKEFESFSVSLFE